MVNSPIPHNLKAEAKKAAKILKDFTIPNAQVGPDKVIPAGLVEGAAGLAVLTVAKLGFLVTARAGSGIVIARLPGGRWSAPSAIGLAGVGGGFEAGAEVTDFVIILYSKNALDAFSMGGNLTLGGNFTIAAGPLGRNLEGDVALRSPAAIYTYSKTRGLFAGISIEGSALIERKDANKKFYGREDIRAFHMLGGAVDPPEDCGDLYQVLDSHREMYEKAMLAQAKKYARRGAQHAAHEGARRYGGASVLEKMKGIKQRQTQRTTHIDVSRDGRHIEQTIEEEVITQRELRHSSVQKSSRPPRPSSLPHPGLLHRNRHRVINNDPGVQSIENLAMSSEEECEDVLPKPVVHRHISKARAMWDFNALLPCDLSFVKDDVLDVLTRTDTQQDWWEGRLKHRVGIFPANYVTLL